MPWVWFLCSIISNDWLYRWTLVVTNGLRILSVGLAVAWCCLLKGNQKTDAWGVNATITTLSFLHCPCTSEYRLAVLVHMSCNNLIKFRRILDWSGCCRIKIRQMPDWSGQCQIEIGIRIPVCEKSSPRLVGSLHPTLIGDMMRFYVLVLLVRRAIGCENFVKCILVTSFWCFFICFVVNFYRFALCCINCNPLRSLLFVWL